MLRLQDWLTCGAMPANGTRLLMYLDYSADDTKVPNILSEVRTHVTLLIAAD